MAAILDRINQPNDLRQLSFDEMNILSQEIRDAFTQRVNTIGGHLAPDLGIVEATIAMHYVFDSPVDKFVFDVSHQCYPHKMLTGRKEGFTNPEKYLTVSGYSNPNESEHDHFTIGHTSTSVSLATGLAKARDLKKESGNVIALIGDGSLSGGEAYEGLNNAAVLGSNFVIIVNDNEMSIAENHGGLYQNLELLRKTQGKAELNFFKALGFDYHYVEEGNDIPTLIEAFKKVKDINHPVVVHIHTLKGKGLAVAEQNKEKFHFVFPGVLDEKADAPAFVQETYTSVTTDFLLNKKQEDPSMLVISPATPAATGFYKDFRDKLGENYTDVGIAEEHAIAYASGVAKNGGKPVIAVLSSFVQRTYDQLSQDLALNHSPATILVFFGAISGADATHLGVFDIPLISNIPNIVYLAPTTKEEYLSMLNWSIEQTEHPAIIRVPSGKLISSGIEDKTDYSVLNKFKVEKEGDTVAIVALGSFFQLGLQAKEEIEKKSGIKATLINPRYISGIDKELLESLKNSHKLVITLEDGVIDGGFGEKITRFYGNSTMKVLNFGAKKEFTNSIPLNELHQRYHLTKELIVQDVLDSLDKNTCCSKM